MRTFLLPAGLLLATAVACGGGGDGPGVATLGGRSGAPPTASPTASADPEEAFLAFARCMRENGVDMPDPGGGGDVVRLRVEEGQDRAELDAAHAKCEHLLQGAVGGFDREERAEMQEHFLAFARCMREQGVDMPDPQFGDGGMVRLAPGDGPGAAPDVEDPKFQAAEKKCRELLPEDLRPEPAGGDR